MGKRTIKLTPSSDWLVKMTNGNVVSNVMCMQNAGTDGLHCKYVQNNHLLHVWCVSTLNASFQTNCCLLAQQDGCPEQKLSPSYVVLCSVFTWCKLE